MSRNVEEGGRHWLAVLAAALCISANGRTIRLESRRMSTSKTMMPQPPSASAHLCRPASGANTAVEVTAGHHLPVMFDAPRILADQILAKLVHSGEPQPP